MSDTRADIEIAWIPAIADAAGPLARALPAGTPSPLPVVPASLRPNDSATTALRAALRERGIRTVALVPRSGSTLASSLLPHRRGAAWRAGTIEGRRWRVDARLTGAHWIAVAIVDADHHTGPFALDLPGRFLHPADRLRLAAQADRLRALADIAAIAPPAACLILSPIAGGWLAVATRDPIAAELWALGLAERFHRADVEMQGPWEESTVQRATELGLGIRIPADMRLDVTIPPAGAVARSLLHQTAARLGRRLDAQQVAGDDRAAGPDEDS